MSGRIKKGSIGARVRPISDTPVEIQMRLVNDALKAMGYLRISQTVSNQFIEADGAMRRMLIMIKGLENINNISIRINDLRDEAYRLQREAWVANIIHDDVDFVEWVSPDEVLDSQENS